MNGDPALIACDESGAEGENITASEHRVFVHAGVHLGMDEAADIMDEIRRLAPSRAPEYKAKQLLSPSATEAAAWLLSEKGPLAQKASVYLVDKSYFAVVTAVDLLIEEVTRARGIDLYKDRQADRWASNLHRKGPQALGMAEWDALISAFNSLMRITQRKGEKTTLDEFFDTLDRVRSRSKVWSVRYILELLSQARPHAVVLHDRLTSRPEAPPQLDPLSAALPQTARFWHEQTRRPVHIIHDRQSMLTPERVETIISQLAEPPPEARDHVRPVALVRVDQVDSRHDPRVQVADLVAGLARSIATAALNDSREARAISLRPFLPRRILWADKASLAAFGG